MSIKYSFLMPYHRRAGQLERTLKSFRMLYRGRDDFEVIIAEDVKNMLVESEHDALNNAITRYRNHFPITHFVTGSDNVWNPVLNYNEAAFKAQGKFVILTNPECVHETNVLSGFDEELNKNPRAYVICACVNEFPHVWYQHSRLRNVEVHFCNALSKEAFFEIGGFNEEYSKGMCFEDDDFRNRVAAAGLTFVCRDDLLITHLKHDKSKPAHYLELHGINKGVYERIWGKDARRAEHIPPVRV